MACRKSFGFWFGIIWILCIIACELRTVDARRKNTKKNPSSINKDKHLAQVARFDGRTPVVDDKELYEAKHVDDEKHQQQNSAAETWGSIDYDLKELTELRSRNLSVCELRKIWKSIHLENIKRRILRELGFSKPPKIKNKYLPPEAVLADVFDKRESDELKLETEDTSEEDVISSQEKIICFEEPHPPPARIKKGDHALYFNISRDLRIQSANLYFHIKPNLPAAEFNVTLYRINRLNRRGYLDLKQIGKQLVGKKTLQNPWIKFDIKKSVFHWFRHSNDSAGFVIRSSTPFQVDLTDNHIENSTESTKPFVAIETKRHSRRRQKRTLGMDCEKGSKETRCCRHPFIVDFDELGWDWIIEPRQYRAYVCNGDCPMAFLLNYQHTHVVQQMRQEGYMGSCCSPSKVSSISMLYFTEGSQIVKESVHEMVVESCGCA